MIKLRELTKELNKFPPAIQTDSEKLRCFRNMLDNYKERSINMTRIHKSR